MEMTLIGVWSHYTCDAAFTLHSVLHVVPRLSSCTERTNNVISHFQTMRIDGVTTTPSHLNALALERNGRRAACSYATIHSVLETSRYAEQQVSKVPPLPPAAPSLSGCWSQRTLARSPPTENATTKYYININLSYLKSPKIDRVSEGKVTRQTPSTKNRDRDESRIRLRSLK